MIPAWIVIGLYGTINSFQVAGLITLEQANYLRETYLEMEVNPNQ